MTSTTFESIKLDDIDQFWAVSVLIMKPNDVADNDSICLYFSKGVDVCMYRKTRKLSWVVVEEIQNLVELQTVVSSICVTRVFLSCRYYNICLFSQCIKSKHFAACQIFLLKFYSSIDWHCIIIKLIKLCKDGIPILIDRIWFFLLVARRRKICRPCLTMKNFHLKIRKCMQRWWGRYV